jgi:hypothetical protein
MNEQKEERITWEYNVDKTVLHGWLKKVWVCSIDTTCNPFRLAWMLDIDPSNHGSIYRTKLVAEEQLNAWIELAGLADKE